MTGAVIAHRDSEKRREFYSILDGSGETEVLEMAHSPKEVFEAVENHDPDVLLLGLQFDRISGLDILDQVMRRDPVPVLMIGEEESKEEAVRAFSYGAVDFISPEFSREEVVELVRMAGEHDLKHLVEREKRRPETPEFSDKILVIGSSTGGPPVVEKILKSLDESFPAPVVVVQHMGEEFTELFAERLDGLSSIDVKEVDGEHGLEPGSAWIAPGDMDILVEKEDDGFVVETMDPIGPGEVPSVDELFKSAAAAYGANTLGVVLTGMGDDGVIGARFIKSAGGEIIVQDRETSKVYGMGKRVVKQGDADHVTPLEDIPEKIARCI